MGERKFNELCEKDKKWNKLKDIPIPARYRWVWEHFIAIWQQCEIDFYGRRVLTYGTVNDYVKCMKVPLSVVDKRLIFKMKVWAFQQIEDMEQKEK